MRYPSEDDSPGLARTLTQLCLLQLAGWSLAPALSHSAPPLDVVEMYVWGREGVVATFKHPNLPGLILDASRRLTGGAIWPAYVIAQLCIVTAFVCVFRLGRELLGAPRALAGTLLLTGLLYNSWTTPELNHNVMQIPLWAFISWALWRAVASDQTRWWVALGIACGLVLWVKYTSVLLLVTSGLWLLVDPKARARLRRPGAWLALLLAGLVAAPQAHYLISTRFLPFDNAMMRATGVESDPWPDFLLAQLVAHAMLLIMAGVAGLFGRGARDAPASKEAGSKETGSKEAGSDDARRARNFLTALGLGPTLLFCLLAIFLGAGLRDMWGTPMYSLSGLLILAWLPGRFDASSLRRITRFATTLLILVPIAYAAIAATRPTWNDEPGRIQWPQAEIAKDLTRRFEDAIGAPLRILAGPPWEAGLVALTAPSRPSVMLEGSSVRAPWVDRAELDRHGFLAVWVPELGPSDSLAALLDDYGVTAADRQEAEYSWSPRASARPVRIGYAIVRPQRTR